MIKRKDPRKNLFKVIAGWDTAPDTYEVWEETPEAPFLGLLMNDSNCPDYLRNEFSKYAVLPLQKEILGLVSCDRCGKCCREDYPILMPSDVRRLSKHFKLTAQQFYVEYCTAFDDELNPWPGKSILPSGIPYLYLPCPFLWNKGNKCRCRIYDIRPIVCKYYPFNETRLIVKCGAGKRIYKAMQDSGEFTESELTLTGKINPTMDVDIDILKRILKILKDKGGD